MHSKVTIVTSPEAQLIQVIRGVGIKVMIMGCMEPWDGVGREGASGLLGGKVCFEERAQAEEVSPQPPRARELRVLGT